MTLLVTTPYFAGFSANLNDHTEMQQYENRRSGQQFVAPGPKKKSLDVSISLHRDLISAGGQSYLFTGKPTPKTQSHNGLPAVDAVLTDSVIAAYEAAIDEFLGDEIPNLTAKDEEAKKGINTYVRLDRIDGKMPKGKPSEFFVNAFLAFYEDAEFKRQITDAGVSLNFLSTEHVLRLMGNQQGEITTEQVAAFRAENSLYDLGALIANEDVQIAVKTMAYSVMSALVGTVENWSNLDVNAWAEDFAFPTFS